MLRSKYLDIKKSFEKMGGPSGSRLIRKSEGKGQDCSTCRVGVGLERWLQVILLKDTE